MQPEHHEEIEIAALGAQGDGVAETDAGTRYVAFALPGERVAPGASGLPRLLSAPSPDRVEPPCRHFGVCGGCVAQHMGARLYAEWKRGVVVAALRRRGLAPPVDPLRRIPPGTRRRAVLTARRQDGPARAGVVLGYHRRKSADLVDIEECPVLASAIAASLPALRAVAALLAAPEVRLTVLATPVGLDVAAETGGRRTARAAIAELGRIAVRHGLARVSIDGETVLALAAPTLRLGGAEVAVPPAAFVQAAEPSEAAMRELVTAALVRLEPRARLVADLFCGLGTFTFALARRARVLAVDGDAAAVAALVGAARHAQGLKPIEAKVRDLFREPLSPKELEPFDAVVFDPPRAGASRQAQALARSRVATVIAVSCDPGTLARDLQTLAQSGGYTIESVTPIDQFVFSAHVEAVAVLRRR
jgi:23S rRNA (uracil1939-C5)-methyltransferase